MINLSRETDKQRICVNMQLKKTFTQLKLKERVLIRRQKRCMQIIFSGPGATFLTVT